MFAEGSVEQLYVEVKLLDNHSRNGKGELTAFLEVQTCDNVTEVKEKILAEMSLGLLTDNYKLFYNDVMLADDAYLIDYNVQDFESLTMKSYSTGYAAGLTPNSTGRAETKCDGGGGSLTSGDDTLRKSTATGGRRELYESDTALPTLHEKTSHRTQFDPSVQLVSMFKEMVQQVSSVGLCCWRSGDADDDCYDDRRGGVDAF